MIRSYSQAELWGHLPNQNTCKNMSKCSYLHHCLASSKLPWALAHQVSSHFVKSHFVNFHFVNIDQMGIDKVGIDNARDDKVHCKNYLHKLERLLHIHIAILYRWKLLYKATQVPCNTNNVSVNRQSLLVFEAILGTSEACCDRGLTALKRRQIDSCFITSSGTILFCFHPAQKYSTLQGKTAHRPISCS